MTYIIIFLLSIALTRCFADDNSTNINQCLNEGEEKKLVTGWSTCHNGRYVLSACQADDGSKIDIGLTVRQRNFLFRCDQTSSSSDSLSLHPIACLRQKDKPENALVIEPGQKVRDAPFVYECTKIPTTNPSLGSLALKAVGCTNATSDIPDGGTVILGDFTYNCSRESGSLTNFTSKEVFLQAKGCLYKGKEYALNSQVIIDNFAYRCRMTQGWPSALEFAIVGCASEGHRYDENERYYSTKKSEADSRVIYQCRHVNNTWSTIPVGCVQENTPPIEHAIGDTWIDSGGPGDVRLKYVVVCRGDANGVGQQSSQCVYQPKIDDAATATTLSGGCMKKFTNPNVLIKCIKGANDREGVSVELINKVLLAKFEKEAIAEGLRYC